MLKKYNCKICNLETNKLSNYNRHLKSKKHLAKTGVSKELAKVSIGLAENANHKSEINKKWVCKYCDKSFKHKSSKSRHEKECDKSNFEIENIKLKQELEETKHKLTSMFNPSDLVSYINEGKIDKDQPIHIHNYNNITNKKTINLTGIKYAKEYYPKAPLLIYQNCETSKKLFGDEKEQIEDKNNNKNNDSDSLELITEEEDVEDNEDSEDKAIKSFNDMEIEDLGEEENIKFVDNVKYYKDRNEMVKIFTNFIIRYYKKENKEEQSLHVIDASRKKFIYTKLEKNLNKIKWVEDINGYNVGRIIINPIINYTIHQVDLYKDRITKKVIELSSNGKIKEISNHSTDVNVVIELSKYLRDNKEKIKHRVLNNMTPIFHLGDIIVKH